MEIIAYIIVGIIVAAILVFLFKIFLVWLTYQGLKGLFGYVKKEVNDIPNEARVIHTELQQGNVFKPVVKFTWRRLWRFFTK